MGSATPAEARGHEEPTAGRAVIEDLAQAVLPTLSPPAAPVPRPRAALDGGPRRRALPIGDPEVVDLTVDHAARRITAFLAFATSVVTLLALLVAYADPGATTVGLALVLAAGTVALWRRWAGQSDATVVVVGSRLEVVSGRAKHVFDLADLRSPVDVIGRPGDRRWRVLFYRRSMPAYVVDASMVDPAVFMRMLHARRPEVHYRPR